MLDSAAWEAIYVFNGTRQSNPLMHHNRLPLLPDSCSLIIFAWMIVSESIANCLLGSFGKEEHQEGIFSMSSVLVWKNQFSSSIKRCAWPPNVFASQMDSDRMCDCWRDDFTGVARTREMNLYVSYSSITAIGANTSKFLFSVSSIFVMVCMKEKKPPWALASILVWLALSSNALILDIDMAQRLYHVCMSQLEGPPRDEWIKSAHVSKLRNEGEWA